MRLGMIRPPHCKEDPLSDSLEFVLWLDFERIPPHSLKHPGAAAQKIGSEWAAKAAVPAPVAESLRPHASHARQSPSFYVLDIQHLCEQRTAFEPARAPNGMPVDSFGLREIIQIPRCPVSIR